jgi:hypothetical protein
VTDEQTKGQPKGATRWDQTDWILLGSGVFLGFLAQLGEVERHGLGSALEFLAGCFADALGFVGVLLVVRNLYARRWYKAFTIAGVILALIFASVAVGVIWLRTKAVPTPAPTPVTTPKAELPSRSEAETFWPRLTVEERKRFNLILYVTMADPAQPTPALHAEFWRLCKKGTASPLAPEELRQAATPIVNRIARVTIREQTLFWEDARTTLATGRPTKSPERDDYEKLMLAAGQIAAEQVALNDKAMQAIAEGRPVAVIKGEKQVVEAAIIDEVMKRINGAEGRIAKLLSTPSSAVD